MGRRLLPYALLALILAGCSPTTDVSAQVPRILVFSRTEAFRHSSIEPAVEALRERAEQAGMVLDATEDADVFTPDDLERYEVIVFLSTTGDVLDEGQQAALEGFVRSGGGFAGVHSASDTEYDWPWYGELVGAWFDGHPPGIRQATLHVVDAAHASTSMLPDPWTRSDEWYDLRDVQPDLHVLLEIDETTYKSPAEGPVAEPRAIAWYHEYDGGRSFYTALGHTEESWSEEPFVDHVWGGVTWAMGR